MRRLILTPGAFENKPLAETRRMIRRLLPVAVLALAAGCGAGPDGSVRGAVTLNGRPLDKGYISFTPEGAQGGTAGGDIEAGRYEVSRLKPGTYRVQVV